MAQAILIERKDFERAFDRALDNLTDVKRLEEKIARGGVTAVADAIRRELESLKYKLETD